MDQTDSTFVYDSDGPLPEICDAQTLPVNMTYYAAPIAAPGGFIYDGAHRPTRLDVTPPTENTDQQKYLDVDEPAIFKRNEQLERT